MTLTAIMASTELEASLILRSLADARKIVIQNKFFFHGRLSGKETVVCLCGTGKVNAAHAATVLIEKYSPEIIYNIGVAGAYPSSGLKIGDIAVAEKEICGDEGVLTGKGFCDMESIGLPLVFAHGRAYFNEFSMFVPEQLRDFRHRGNFVTVSACTGTLQEGLKIEKRLSALCESMEGAAIAHVCALNSLPVVEMRGISNIIEDRAAGPLSKRDIITAAENVQRVFLEELLLCDKI
jgi:futalosine hydrolase